MAGHYTRFEVWLPCRLPQHREACQLALADLRSFFWEGHSVCRTDLGLPVWTGWWRESRGSPTDTDAHILFCVDRDPVGGEDLKSRVDRVERIASRWYAAVDGAYQRVVYVTAASLVATDARDRQHLDEDLDAARRAEADFKRGL